MAAAMGVLISCSEFCKNCGKGPFVRLDVHIRFCSTSKYGVDPVTVHALI